MCKLEPESAGSGLMKGCQVKQKTVYSCQKCGLQSPKWLGRCSDCGEWNSLVEEVISVSKKGKALLPVAAAVPATHDAS